MLAAHDHVSVWRDGEIERAEPQQTSFDLVIALIPSLECRIHESSANNRQLGPFHEGMDHIAPAPLPWRRGMDYPKDTRFFWCFARQRTQKNIKGSHLPDDRLHLLQEQQGFPCSQSDN
jgi:hypothetical protein